MLPSAPRKARYRSAVDFEIAHDIPASADRVEAALLSEDYQRSLSDLTSLADRELLSQESTDGGRVRRKIRCVLDVQLNSTAKRLVGDSDPAWIEESQWNPKTKTWDWKVIPEVGGSLLEAKGTIAIEEAGSDKVTRRVTGKVKVNIPLYGGKVEKTIVGGLERAYEEEAGRLSDWVSKT